MKPYTVWINGQEIPPTDGFHSTEISPLVSLGFSIEDAVDMLKHRRAGNNHYVALAASAIVNGVSRKEIDEALETNAPAARAYLEERKAGAGHQDALKKIRDLHVCRAERTETLGGLDPVLGTGSVTHITYCACGQVMWRNTIRKSWSGD